MVMALLTILLIVLFLVAIGYALQFIAMPPPARVIIMLALVILVMLYLLGFLGPVDSNLRLR